MANHTVSRAEVDEAIKAQIDPRGLRGLPNMIAMQIGLPVVPPDLAALGTELADPSKPLTLTVACGEASYVVEIR